MLESDCSIVLIEQELFYAPNEKKIGEIFADVDGYYKFWPELNGGYWEAIVLHDIAEMLDRMNKDWDKQVREMTTISAQS